MSGREGRGAVTRADGPAATAAPIDVPPLAALRAFGGPRAAWLAPGEPSVVGVGEAAAVTASGPGRFDAVREEASALFDSLALELPAEAPSAAQPRLLGGLAFHDDPEPGPPWRGFPGARFVLPRVQVTALDDGNWLTVVAEPGEDPDAELATAKAELRDAGTSSAPPPGVSDLRRSPDRAGWREQVEAAVARIEAGELEKVVLAQTLTAKLRGAFRLADALERLGEAYPACYRFAVDPGLGAGFFGATPERLVRQRGGRVETHALAGSIGRGGSEAEDRRLAGELESSPKVTHEHAVVLEAIREQLGTVAASVSVGERSVRKLANVQHLDAQIEASLRDGTHVLEVAEALHPTPAVGGRPPGAAEALIGATERFDRGWYAGPVGWFDGTGDGTFAVAIRSAVATAHEATLFAGNGIVADSDAEAEWDELQLKYRPVLDQLR